MKKYSYLLILILFAYMAEAQRTAVLPLSMDQQGQCPPNSKGKKREQVFPHYKKLKPFYKHDLKIDEPSDICMTSDDPTHFYVVGNRGNVCVIDENGNVLSKSKQDGGDYEAVCVKDHQIYVFDESMRRIYAIDEKNYQVTRTMEVPYSGARNKGFEGLTYIPSEKKFIAIIEKPAMVYELNEQLQVTNQLHLKQFNELSAVTYHDNYLWFLSDEGHRVMKVNPNGYDIVDQWTIPVVNPEGIAFDAAGNLLIVSDDMGKLFKFKIQ